MTEPERIIMFRVPWMNDKGDTPYFYDNSFYNVPSTGIPQLRRVERGFYQQKIYLLSDFTYNITIDTEETTFLFNEEANQKRAEELHKDALLQGSRAFTKSRVMSLLGSVPKRYLNP